MKSRIEKLRRIAAMVVLAGTLLARAGALHAQGAPPEPQPDPGMAGGPGPEHIAALAGELGLSAEQQKALRTLLLGLRKTQIQARADLELAGLELETALEADDPDAKVVATQIDRLGALETAVRKARMLAMLSARKLLTPAQRDKLARFAARMPTPPRPPRPGDPALDPLNPFPRGGSRMRPPAKPTGPDDDVQVDVMDPFGGRKPTGNGTVVVSANPFAEVFIDGKKMGLTPLRASVTRGRHRLELRFKGGPSSVRAIEVRSGETTRIAVEAPGP